MSFLIRRILSAVPTMFVVALFVFSLLHLAPGDPAAIIAGDQATPDEVAKIRQSLGLDQPFIIQFGSWLLNVVRGELGNSIFTGLPVANAIAERIAPTFYLMTLTLIVSLLIGVPLGILAAWHKNTVSDFAISVVAVLGFSIPVFVLGYALAYVFAVSLGWLPVQGYVSPDEGIGAFLRSLALPTLSLSGIFIALIARMSRAAILEVLNEDYIRTARAKGMGNRRLLFLHALKNAAVPIVTVVGIGVAMLISGAVVTESVFSIPGLGRLVIDAVLRRDYPIIQGVVLFFSVVYVIINLLVDVVYMMVDPRIRY